MNPFSTKLLSDHSQYKKSPSSAKGPNGDSIGARVYIFGSHSDKSPGDPMRALIDNLAPDWFLKISGDQAQLPVKEVTHFTTPQGPVWVIGRRKSSEPLANQTSSLHESDYAWYREQVGSLLSYFRAYQLKQVSFFWLDTESKQELGALVGLNMAAYHFKTAGLNMTAKDFPVIIHDRKWDEGQMREVRGRSLAVNLARHLVNVPPNHKNPKTYSQFIKKLFTGKKHFKVDIWNTARLKKEKMGLHLGVGQGASESPCLVHIQYRPQRSTKRTGEKRSQAPIAFVGKGVTFDSGGLDIKPSSGMRLMKKDMGGSGAVVGLALWASEVQHSRPLDFYLALAENAVDAQSMRPSDVLEARNGMKVEIHNTDAEGRLVLADALDVAVSADHQPKEAPEIVIDVATLTGAIKVALGADLAGLFANDETLSEELHQAGQRAGDLNWPMPLFQKYNAGMATPFADVVNAIDGFGGAITAALFLQKFVRNTKWAHLDIYAWNDKPSGPLAFAGGSGQAVQCLIEWLQAGK